MELIEKLNMLLDPKKVTAETLIENKINEIIDVLNQKQPEKQEIFTRDELRYLMLCIDVRDIYTRGDSNKKLVDVKKLKDKLSKLTTK